MMTTEEMVMYDMIVELGIATAEEINLAFNISDMGWTDVLNRICYIRVGFSTLQGYLDSLEEE